MKLSISTFGWSGYSWRDICALAKDSGFKGIEIHDKFIPSFAGERDIFDPTAANAVYRDMFESGIEIPCIDSSCNISAPTHTDECAAEIERCIETAHSLRVPYVRIGARDCPYSKEEQEASVMKCLERVVPAAEAAKVTLLIETIGMFADTDKLCETLNSFACDSLAALWDMQHTFRKCGETPEKTVKNLGSYIKHVHLKDSDVVGDTAEYRLIGEGTLPIDDMVRALYSINYDGYISMEWEQIWIAEIDNIELIALHFANYMSRFGNLARLSKSKRLYDNKRGTGKFVWQKETIIDYTFPQVLDKMVEEFPDQYAFKYTTLDYTRTYSEFRDDVDEFARVLISLGVKAQSHVAVWATNLPQWYIAFWATTKIGAVLVTVNTAYKIHEAEYLLRQSDTHTLVMIEGFRDSNYKEIMNELCPELKTSEPGKPLSCKRLPFLRNIITVGFRMDGALTWEEALARADMAPVEE
ncbi:MAG: TIM barrel protein, partial [Synergistaceae bacterium]|nr:TIM barrel protein [Synergistaceae bacterium]